MGSRRNLQPNFFETLLAAGVARVVDVRLNNVSQLAGFAKKQDLSYILDKIGAIQYRHIPLLAPTQQMLDLYKKHGGGWEDYERKFLQLMKERQIETAMAQELNDADCLLCSEERPDHCHRRLVAEYLAAHHDGVRIQHLG